MTFNTMNHNFLKGWLATIVLLFGFSLTAQNIISDRPGIGDGVSTLPKNRFQLETGLEYARFQTGSDYVINQNTLPIALLRYGLGDKVELRLIQSYYFIDMPKLNGDYSSSGFSNTSIGSKFKLTENANNGIQTSVLLELLVPTGSKEVASNKFLLSLRYIHSWDFSEQWNLTSNLGAYWAEEQAIGLTYSFAVGYAINNRWGVFFEPFGDLYQLEDFNISIDGGITCLLNPKMQVDASLGTGLNRDFYFIGLGFSWLIGK